MGNTGHGEEAGLKLWDLLEGVREDTWVSVQSVRLRRDRRAPGDEVVPRCGATLRDRTRHSVETEGLVDDTVDEWNPLELLRKQLRVECGPLLLLLQGRLATHYTHYTKCTSSVVRVNKPTTPIALRGKRGLLNSTRKLSRCNIVDNSVNVRAVGLTAR